MAKRWSVEGTRRWRGGRVGGLYDGIDFYVCEKYKMMDINLPRLAAILLLLLLLLFCHSSSSLGSVTLSLSLSLFFATAFSRISPSPFLQRFHHRITLLLSRIGRTQFTRCTATLISARARRALCARPVYRVCRFQDQSSRKS